MNRKKHDTFQKSPKVWIDPKILRINVGTLTFAVMGESPICKTDLKKPSPIGEGL
jgi:hypothetical protein